MRSLFAVLSMASVLAVAPAAAQAPTRTEDARSSSTWKISTRLETIAEYDDNVFLLPTNKRDNVSAPSAAERLSGRYDLMESYGDVIGTVRASATVRGDGFRGRRLSIAPAVGYELFAQNAERRNAVLAIAVAQDLRRDGRLRLRAGYRPDYYARNFLFDAVDADQNGSITADERRYARGDHSEFDVELDYRHRLAKSRRVRPFGAFVHVGMGYAERSFNAPFSARDFRGPTGSVRLEVSPRRGLEFESSYELALSASPVTEQVILLDEQVFGEDLNGNGTATDVNARAVRTVDRSRHAHVFGETVRVELGRRTDLELLVRYRIRTFTSREPYDVANNGRRDQRLQAGAELTRRIARGIRLVTAVRYGFQSLNRRTDLGAEGAVDDYTKLQAQVGVRYTP